jgi:hypothetical protein
MRLSYATVSLVPVLLVSACSAPAARVEIAAHYVPACAPASESAPAQLELIALGDFDRSNDSVAILQSDAALRSLPLPEGTRAAELNTLGAGAFWGAGALDAHNRLPILLWPKDRACALARIDADAADGADGSWLLGASARLGTLLVAAPGAASATATALAVDLSRASAEPLAAELGPRRPRAGASLSELGESLVLAGGVERLSGSVLGSAELFEPALGQFTGETRALSTPRARHAALALSGGTLLLIGGETEGGGALRSVEVLSLDAPRLPRAFELLAAPRIEPQAVLLGGARILVGGGYTRSAGGARLPVASVEFLSTDLADVTEPPITLEPAALDRAFVALGPSGALAAGGCELGALREDCIPCEGGCVSRDVWWIDERGSAHPLEPLPSELAAPAPKLLSGSGGSPWLLAGGRLARFEPWLARFESVEVARAPTARVLGEPIAIDPGLFVWLEESEGSVSLMGLFHSQRGPFAQDTAPLLIGSGRNVVPHRPPVADASGVRLEYQTAIGLELSGPAAVVSVADTSYADFTLELVLVSGPPPLIELIGSGSEDNGAAFGGIDCPWPDVEPPLDPASRSSVRLQVRRTQGRVRLALGEAGVAAGEPCQRVLPERVSIRLVGTPAGTSRINRVELRRQSD